MQHVTFFKDGQPVSRERLMGMEIHRARRMMALFMRKLGSQGMADLFASEISEMAMKEHGWTEASAGRMVASIAQVRVREGSAAEFVQWFLAGYMGRNAPAMMRAHPEHLGALVLEDGRIGILEVPGHTDLPAKLHLRRLDSWPAGAPDELDPSMPIRMMGRSETPDGKVCGYLLHQFRETDPGFEARLAIYWPASTPHQLVEGHADHLMLEFNNWLCAYLETRHQNGDLMPVALGVNC
ncbi:hypothetical protein [uncultured Hydrogenophaga sp.]|uniref:hypothetical protein n=1 Tax=uncultured Hydrogenophaga sp. TaxID=199683 RepID=UPI00258DB690|nr:hypothetical protein [uncultured Hydrogenophaga sp.]